MLIQLIAQALSSRQQFLLNNDWQFRYNMDLQNKSSRRVDLPHTWNQNDSSIADLTYRRVLGIYEKQCNFTTKSHQGKRTFIKFEGAFQVAHLLINGLLVGEHRGGYQTFTFEITNFIQLDQKNKIDVHVNSAEQLDVMPLCGGDFNMYGGLYRDVYIIIQDQTGFDLLDYGTNGIYIYQKNITNQNAIIGIEALINSQQEGKFDIQVQISDKNTSVCNITKQVEISKEQFNKSITTQFQITISKPHLWNLDDPYLYSFKFVLQKYGVQLDEVNEKTGFRYFSVSPQTGFQLNGKKCKLIGATMHQEAMGIVTAMKYENFQRDVELVKETGFTTMRLIHYQHNQMVYRLFDEYGVLILTEIPFVGQGGYKGIGFINSPAFRENGIQQLKELIKQNMNHPSVISWGLFNELHLEDPAIAGYVDELNVLAHKMDPTRITYTANRQTDGLGNHSDLDLHNLYYGWYRPDINNMSLWLDEYHQNFSQQIVGISEHGAGASIFHQSEQLISVVPTSDWHPENYQTYVLVNNFQQVMERDYVASLLLQEFYDFSASHRTEGAQHGLHDKGIVTFDRKTRKDAFYFYKANLNALEKTLHIAEKRLIRRQQCNQQFQVFSSEPNVALYLNGVLVQTKQTDKYKIVYFQNILLKHGKNKIEVRTETMADKAEIYVE